MSTTLELSLVPEFDADTDELKAALERMETDLAAVRHLLKERKTL